MPRSIARRLLDNGQTLSLIHGDLTEEVVDAVVNAANRRLEHGGGVAGAVSRRGGPSIQAESDAWVRAHGLVPHDRPAITGAGQLPCRHVIHAVGPAWSDGDEEAKLAAAINGSLAVAEERQLKSIAFPAISTGIFRFPKERAAGVILDTILAYYLAHPRSGIADARITIIDDPTLQVFRDEFYHRWPESLGAA
ncbi:MAG TPA: macro domain-containing protein [Anaerolineales bacterium]|nr:macro domain-containing protein [Anaerolineales bacterium]